LQVIVCLLGIFPVCGGAAEENRVRVGLYAEFQQEPSVRVRTVIREELASIMMPTGAVVEWRPLERAGKERWSRLVVVHFKGRCDSSDLSLYDPYPWVLGQTYISDGEIIPFSDIYCTAIRAMLAQTLVSTDRSTRPFVFARAVARVLAHELYHVLAATRHHASGGLGEGFYSARELAADDFRFEDKEIQRLQKAIAPPPKPANRSFLNACQAAGQ